MKQLKILKLTQNAILPVYASDGASGMDLSYSGVEDIIIAPGKVVLVPTSISIMLEEGYEAQIRPRSGLAAKHAITVLNSPGTIDSDYRGEIKIIMINHSKTDFVVQQNMRIAQMVIAKYNRPTIQEVKELDPTNRNKSGFGSTGISKLST